MPASSATPWPEGFVYRPDFLSAAEEAELLAHAAAAAYEDVVFRGVRAKRRVVHYGYDYAYDSRSVRPGRPLPEVLRPLVARAAATAGLPAQAFGQALLTYYPAGSGIGWHRDAPAFGAVAGISLGGPATLRLRPIAEPRRVVGVPLAPRSLYLLSGEARSRWQHHIPPGAAERWSITFRTLR